MSAVLRYEIPATVEPAQVSTEATREIRLRVLRNARNRFQVNDCSPGANVAAGSATVEYFLLLVRSALALGAGRVYEGENNGRVRALIEAFRA